MPTDQLKLEADANDVIREVRRASEEFKQYNKDLEKTAEVSKTVTSASKEMTRQLTTQDRAGNKVVITQKKTAEGWEHQSTVVSKAVKSQKELTAVTINYASALRLVGVQLAHRAIASSVSSIREAAVEYKNIAIAIGEIKTISQGIPLTNEQWLQGARDLSATFGTSTRDQLEATYQALSNQVVKTSEDLHFLAAANKFAITAATSNENAVNLLSSALNSYNLDVTQAEAVSAKLFKTIELGRVRADELANTFGSVALISKQTNIEMDELLAFMAALSKQGFKASETMTQLRGIIVKILKPTEKMKEFFNDLGVASGEEALRVHGLVGFLEELRKSTGGSSTELGKMISRIRGLSAGLFGTSERGLTEIADALDRIRNSSESFETAYTQMLGNIGTRTNIQTQRIKLYYQELAESGVTTFTEISEAIGGADVAVKLITRSLAFGLIAASVRAAAGLNVLAIAAARAKLAAGAAAIGGAPTIIAVGAAVAAAAVYTYIEKRAEDSAKAESDYRKKVIFDINKAGADSKIAYGKNIDEQLFVLDRFYVIQRKWRLQDLESLKGYYFEAQAEVKKYYSFTIFEAGAASKKISKEYNQTLSDLESITKERQDTIRGTRDSVIDTLIGQREGADKIGAFKEVLDTLRKEQIASAKAGNKEEFDYVTKRIRSIFQEQVKFEEKLATSNKEAIEKRSELSRKKAAADAEYRRSLELSELEDTDLAKSKVRGKANNDYQKALFKIREEESKIKVIKFQQNDAVAAKLKLEAQNLKQLDILEAKLRELAKIRLKEKIEAEISTEKLKSGLTGITKFKLDKALGGDADSIESSLKSVRAAYSDYISGQSELGIELTKAADIQKQFEKLTAALERGLQGRQIEELQKRKDVIRKDVKDAQADLVNLQTSLDRRIGRNNLALQDVRASIQGAIGRTPSPHAFAQNQLDTEQYFANRLKESGSPKELVKEAKEAYKWVQKNVAEDQLREELSAQLLRIQAEMVAYLKEQQGIQDRKNRVVLRELELQKLITSEIEKQNEIRRSRGIDTQDIEGTGDYSGSVYGRDNRVTRIAKGESVINSGATKRHYNQLVAINGQAQSAVNGNSVSIGDINVNLNSSGSAKVDARAIALEIRGLAKRGVIA